MTTELETTLRLLQPRLAQSAYAFCRIYHGRAIPAAAVGWFREEEGATVILPLAEAAGLSVDFEAAWITLGVESSLAAVGLTAAVAAALAKEGIACNVVAACRHDHLFVPFGRGEDALRVLRFLTGRDGPEGLVPPP